MAAECAARRCARAVRRLRRRRLHGRHLRRDDPGARRGRRRRAGPGDLPSAPIPPLTPDTNRADLVAGRNLTVDGGGGSIPTAGVTYGGTLTATGTLNCARRAAPGAAAVRLRRRSSPPFASAPRSGRTSPPTAPSSGPGGLRHLSSPAPTRPATSSRSALRRCRASGQIAIDVPPRLDDADQRHRDLELHERGCSSVVLTSGPRPSDGPVELPATPSSVQQASGLEWQGTHPGARTPPRASPTGSFTASSLAASAPRLGSEGDLSSTSASPAACRRSRRKRTLSLASLCTDPVTLHHTHAPAQRGRCRRTR